MVVFAVVVAAVVVELGGFLLNGFSWWPSPVYTVVEAVALVGSVWAVDAYRRRRLTA